jgi:hypothetical protein
MQPTAVDFGDSDSVGYAIPTRRDLCGVVDFRHDPFEKGDHDLCGNTKPTPYDDYLALRDEHNNGCAETQLPAMKDEFAGGKHFNVIVFNAGLHDFQIKVSPYGCGASTPAKFNAAVEALATEAIGHGDVIIWVDVTPVPVGWDKIPAGIETVINPIGEAIAREHHFYILNWDSKYQLPQNVHYTEQGYEYLGQQLADCINTAMAGQETDRCHH